MLLYRGAHHLFAMLQLVAVRVTIYFDFYRFYSLADLTCNTCASARERKRRAYGFSGSCRFYYFAFWKVTPWRVLFKSLSTSFRSEPNALNVLRAVARDSFVSIIRVAFRIDFVAETRATASSGMAVMLENYSWYCGGDVSLIMAKITGPTFKHCHFFFCFNIIVKILKVTYKEWRYGW